MSTELVRIVATRRDITQPGSPIVITAEGIELVARLAERGHTEAAIAGQLRISRDTFRACKARQPELAEALECGRGVIESKLIDKLIEKALAGEIVPLIFALKGRFGWKEGDPRDTAPNVNVQVINLPRPMTEAEYAATLEPAIDDEDGGEP